MTIARRAAAALLGRRFDWLLLRCGVRTLPRRQHVESPRRPERAWRAGPVRLLIEHFHPIVSATLAVDLVFGLWPRLMSTYGGF
jgi:hypothetical protein